MAGTQWRVAVLYLTISLGAAPVGAADDPAKLFNDLYSAEARQVLASRDKADDVAFAAKVLEAARTITDAPAIQLYFAQKASDFAENAPEGYATAIDASRLIAQADSKQRPAMREKITKLARLSFIKATVADRAAVGAGLVKELSDAADEAREDGDAGEATAYLRQALSVATQLKLTEAAEIREKLEALTSAAAAQAKLRALQERLLVDANDKATAKAIVDLLVIEMNNPTDAIRPAERTGDATLAANVAIAAREVSSWTGPESLVMGDWYRALAGQAPAHAKRDMQERARVGYARFLFMHSENDASRTKASLFLRELEAALEDKPGPVVNTPTTPTTPTQPTTPEVKIIPPRVADLDVDADVTFDNTKAPYVITGTIRVIGKENVKLRVAPGVEIHGGKFNLQTKGGLVLQGEANKPIVFKNVEIIQDLHGSLNAKYTVFENCTFRKGGAWWSNWSSRWTFDHCLIHACKFPKLTEVDYGITITNCTITFMTFPDATGPLRHNLRKIDSCNFAGCSIPPSIVLTSQQCNYFGCTFVAGAKYKGKTAITADPYLFKSKGAPPQTLWTPVEEGAGAVTVTPSMRAYSNPKFPLKPNIAELRADRALVELLFD
ncbi:MAG: hypothetical protein WD768_21435 [Phycisphaeraceae bacterium]